MTLSILHLSDIHIKDKNDPILQRSGQIAAALNPDLSESDAVVILISGDIAQAGINGEYELASKFLNELNNAIKHETNVPIHFVISPGNHDCDFSGDQDARTAIIQAALKRSGDMPGSYVEMGVSVQKEFFNFRKTHEAGTTIQFSDELWTTYAIEVGGKKLLFDALNASWVSQRYEQQGGLIFPFEKYEKLKLGDADLRVSILHHPLNWYGQSNYFPFRSFLHRMSDFLFSGHEHQSAGRATNDAETGECIYIEGAALQQRTSSNSGFNIVQVDLESKKFRYQKFKFESNRYHPQQIGVEWSDYRALPKKAVAETTLTEEFLKILKSPGATLKHPTGRSLELDDIYIFPDLDVKSIKGPEELKSRGLKKLNSKVLCKVESLARNVLLEGDDSSGKTRLLFRLYHRFHAEGHLPLFLRGAKIKSSSPGEIERYLDAALTAQYGAENKVPFEQATKSRKILLLDDLDLSPLNRSGRSKFLEIIIPKFSRVFITVGENYELAEFFDGDAIGELALFNHYKILELGHERRADLIKKWNSIGIDETVSHNQLLALCDQAEDLIESARLQHLASTVPIFVLSLLQAAASGITKDQNNSSFAHYYYFLIVGALEQGGVKVDEIAPYLAACTHLSWFIKKHGHEHQISTKQFDQFVTEYSENWTLTNGPQLLRILIASDLVDQDGDCLCFAYPYAYYYFLGRYTNTAIIDEDVKEYLRYCMKNLYVRECANTLIFLAHHSGNSVVLDHIVSALDNHFPKNAPVTLSKDDIGSIAKLIAFAPSIKYKAQKPEEYRRAQAQKRDEENDNQDGLVEKPNGDDKPRDLFQEMVSLNKSIEIAGALLTHQYSNYSRVKKDAAVKSIFDGSLRAIREFYTYFEMFSEELVKAVTFRAKVRSDGPTAEQAELQTRYAIGFLLRAIGATFVTKAGMHVTAKALASNVADVMDSSPSCAYRLIKIAQDLQRPSRLPRLEIKRLINDESENPCVMGVLQLLVLKRMYMYETEFDDKDWAISTFEVGGNAKSIEMKHRKPSAKRWDA
jgi:hypothetical protein